MYRLTISKKVKKFLLSHPNEAKLFYSKIKILLQKPQYNNSIDVKKLTGEQDKYRLRIGKYRFLYEIIEDEILVFVYDANSRGDIY